MNAARKVVFSRTLRTAEWANTTTAAGDTTEEIDKLRRGGDGHIVVWGGASFWRSLMQLDLIDEFRLDLHPGHPDHRPPGAGNLPRRAQNS
jgi:dihydrofolate reductase